MTLSAPWIQTDPTTWRPRDFGRDGTHPSTYGETKVGELLLDFFRTSPFTQPWFTNPIPGDVTVDGNVNFDDLLIFARNYGASSGQTWTDGDVNGDQVITFEDLLLLAQHYGDPLADSGNFDNQFGSEWTLSQSLVPEPAALVLATLFGAAVRRTRVPVASR